MPENEDKALQFDVPDQDWLSRDEWYVAEVQLGGDDFVELIAVSGSLVDELNDLVAALADIWPEDTEGINEFAVLQQALEGGLTNKLWQQIDKLLVRYVKFWRLVDYAKACGVEEPSVPSDIKDKDRRLQIIKDLPIPTLGRILYGLAWHTKNFR